MLKAIISLLLVIIMVAVLVIWVYGILSSDGKCHFEDCDNCVFPCDPDMKKRLKPERDGTVYQKKCDTDE